MITNLQTSLYNLLDMLVINLKINHSVCIAEACDVLKLLSVRLERRL